MRLIADECIPPVAFEKLRGLRNPKGVVVTEMVHLLDRFEPGEPDDGWVLGIADESPPFMVITGDRAAQTRTQDPRLPTLLAAARVNGVFLTGTLQQRKAFEKIRALMVVWPRLEQAYTAEPGSRFKLQIHGDSYRLVAWPPRGH